jgi:hypothetical protein
MEALRDQGTLWLTRTSDIHAHLAVAVAERRPVQLAGPGIGTVGTFEISGEGWINFAADPTLPTPLPRLGATVRASYDQGVVQCSFYTSLVSVDRYGQWVLQEPLSIERADRRIVERFQVAGKAGFCFRVSEWPSQPVLGVHDLSATGVSLLNDPRRHALQFEQLLEGYLHLPGEAALPMCVEIRNSREIPRQAGLRVYGSRITGIATVHQQALVGFLAEWGRRNPR